MFIENIGVVGLTENQRLNWVKTGIWERISYVNGEVIGVAETEPQQSDIDLLISAVNSLLDVEPAWVRENAFNVDLMTKRISDVISDAREIALMPYLGGVQSAAKAKNFTKAKSLINGLGQAAIATEEEVAAIKGVFSEQGIDLGSY